jgi:hypothetical protein
MPEFDLDQDKLTRALAFGGPDHGVAGLDAALRGPHKNTIRPGIT